MNENETTALVRTFDRAYINGKFVTPHGTHVVDLVNPTNNTLIGKVTMADEIDTRQAIAAAKEAFNTFSQSGKEYRMDCLRFRCEVCGGPAGRVKVDADHPE
jgi:aldehyde dehydrogenase (NAD+)